MSPAKAANFRGTELGSPCASIPERERLLGSKELGDVSLTNQHRFTGRAFDRNVTITYLCKDGAFILGDLHFQRHQYNDVVADFHAAYAKALALGRLSTQALATAEYALTLSSHNASTLDMLGVAPADGWILDAELRGVTGEQLDWNEVLQGKAIASLLLVFNNGARLRFEGTEVLSIELVRKEYVEQWNGPLDPGPM